MTYLLYMKRSFTRCPRRHAVLFAVLTCAFLLPLLISVYRDSNAWGTRQYLLARSAGETYHIGNATEADVPYFEDIRGLSAPVYRDGTIYLHILSDEEWRNAESVTVFENEIRKRMEASGNEALLPTAFSYEYAHGISTDPSHLSGSESFCSSICWSLCSRYRWCVPLYQSHLKRFSSDIGTLRACGASRHQISALFAVELAAVFLLAAACAVVISILLLKTLFTAFLEIRHDSLAWLIFHVEPMNILLHLAVFFVTLGLSLGMTLHRYSREPVRVLLNDTEKYAEGQAQTKAPQTAFHPGGNPLRSVAQPHEPQPPFLSCRFRSRHGSFSASVQHPHCCLAGHGRGGGMGLKVSHSSHDGEGFSAEDMAYVSSLAGVKQTRPVYEPDDYILLPESPEEVETPLRIRPYSGLGAAAQTLSSMRSPSAARRNAALGMYCGFAGRKHITMETGVSSSPHRRM